MKSFIAIIVVLAVVAQIKTDCASASAVANKVVDMAAACANKKSHGMAAGQIASAKAEVKTHMAQVLGCRRRMMKKQRRLGALCVACPPACKGFSVWASGHIATYGVPADCTQADIEVECNKQCNANC